jgi:hypothetical protein
LFFLSTDALFRLVVSFERMVEMDRGGGAGLTGASPELGLENSGLLGTSVRGTSPKQ